MSIQVVSPVSILGAGGGVPVSAGANDGDMAAAMIKNSASHASFVMVNVLTMNSSLKKYY